MNRKPRGSGVMSRERSDQWGTDSASVFSAGFGKRKIVSTGVRGLQEL